jgi:Fe-S cluster assembly ATP-binding protein
MINGKIVKTGGLDLIAKIDSQGYDWVKTELGITDFDQRKEPVSLGTCPTKSLK